MLTLGWIADDDLVLRGLTWLVIYLLWTANLAAVFRHPDDRWQRTGHQRGVWLAVMLVAGFASFAVMGVTIVAGIAYLLFPARALRRTAREGST